MQTYQDMVFSTAARLLGNHAQAEDIAQEVFLKAYVHFARLQTSSSAGGWLKTVTTNLALNHLSRYRRRWRLFADLPDDQSEMETPELNLPLPDTLMEGIHHEQRQQLLERALRQLPEHQRVPLVLHHFEDLSYCEIAKRLQVSLAKIKIDILRGRIALAKRLSAENMTHV